MKRSLRSSSRIFRLLILALCYALILTTITPLSRADGGAGPQSSSRSNWLGHSSLLNFPARALGTFLALFQGGGGGLPSVPGPNLPDLDAARAAEPSEPDALDPIPSEQSCEDCEPCLDCVNLPPIANTGGPYSGVPGQPVPFNGLSSEDPEGEAMTFLWTFGDGATATGGTPTHTYATANTYTVTLKVTDPHGAFNTASTQATIGAASTPTPTPTPTASPSPTPANAADFVSQSVPSSMNAGQRYNVSVTMRNTGNTTWSAGRLYRLGSQNSTDNTIWGRKRVYLRETVAPGATVTFAFSVVAPYNGVEEPPPTSFQWRMIQENFGYFGATTTNQVVSIVSNYIPQNQGGSPPDEFSDYLASLIAVKHRTGQSGTDLVSGNYNWGLGLMNLPGRAGLDLNLALSYNSLAAWTKVVSPDVGQSQQGPFTSFTFDVEKGFPSVGFRLGFPIIQGPYDNYQAATLDYLLLLPSGARVELRRVGTTNVYESVDSSYLQLLDGGEGTLSLKTTDGTKLAYRKINKEYRCTEVKDRNGNFITIKYDPLSNDPGSVGRMSSIIDTLGRTIDFHYDKNYRLLSITQERNGHTHIWASFGYEDKLIETNFVDGYYTETGEIELISEETPPVYGLPNSHTVSLLSQVSLSDGSRYNFSYNTWGQVVSTHHYAPNSDELGYTAYNLPADNSDPQIDSPRFTERVEWVKDFNNNDPFTTTYQFDFGGQWGKATAPDGTSYKEFFTSEFSDWRRGLVTRTETFSADSTTPKKVTVTDWTQDNTIVAYQLNPRATATTISDSDGNRRRTTLEYDEFGLVSDVFELGPTGTTDWTLLRRTHTDYEMSIFYLNQRLIGLPKQRTLFGPEDNGQRLYSKVSYEYDAAGTSLVNQGNPVQHDTNFGAGLLTRGNVTKSLRWDVDHELDANLATTSSVGYNTNGSAIFSIDARNHQTTVSYSDSFSANGIDLDSVALTLAYPTSVTDPDNFSSTTRYHYDLGTITRQQDPKGAAQTTQYDSSGRVRLFTNQVTGAYTRFVYPPSHLIVNKFATIKDLTTETYTATVLDGAGRTRAVAGDFPNSTGHYSGQFMLYDVNGQVIQKTNPTEMNHAWAAAGDDSVGWRSSTQTFDWNGRPLVTTNTDGTTKTASYGGCGCAGSAVITLTDEGTIVGGVEKKRQQKVYSDVLGRTVKTETLNWDGAGSYGTGGTVYSTLVNNYNARDQVTTARQYQGTSASSVYQDATMTYDGYGRLQTQHLPQEAIGTAGTRTYFADDTLQTATDARGATATYTYNNRGLVETIAYEPSAGVPDTASVAFEYDAAGNRLSMTDGPGSVTYAYNTLSQMTSETRSITGVGTFPIAYEYHPTGQLKKVTNPMGSSINYTYDTAGRTNTVTGSDTLYAGVSSYATNYKYRAWGGLKEYSYGNSSQHLVSLTYTGRGQVSQYKATFNTPFATQSVTGNYVYSADGRLRSSTEQGDNRHDRAYVYDHAARLTQALTGAEARGETPAGDPFKQNYGYNAFDNLTSRTGHHWGTNQPAFTATYVNDRNTNSQWQYDADGQVLVQVNSQITRQYVYDAVGLQVSMTEPPRRPNRPTLTMTQTYDGDGQRIKNVQNSAILYEIRSTVLGGQVLSEMHGQGVQTKGFVYANGATLARQGLNEVTWVHEAPDGTGQWESNGIVWRTLELDPFGDDVGVDDPYAAGDGLGDYPSHGDPADFDSGCTFWGSPIICEVLSRRNRALNSQPSPRHNDARTPPISPSIATQITFGTLVRGVLENTPFGDFLYPKADQLWRFINPFVPPGTLSANPQDSGINHAKILNDTIDRVKKRLTGDCLKLFDKFDPTAYMADYLSISETTPAGTSFVDALTAASTLSNHDGKGNRLASGSTVFNQNSAFFSGVYQGKPFPESFIKATSSFYGLSFDELREVSLLHELFHINDVAGAYNDDTADGDLNLAHSKAINKLIRAKCGFPTNPNLP